MNKELKVLAKKLIAIILSLALVTGWMPEIVSAEDYSISHTVIDSVDTYYNGFNDDVAVATGTYIQLVCDEQPGVVDVSVAVPKEEGAYFSQEITLGYSTLAEARVVYENGNVLLRVVTEESTVYEEILYTPQYVDLTEMPTISLGEEVTVAGETEIYCERYYLVEYKSMEEITYIAYTSSYEDEDSYRSDTFMNVYDGEGYILDKNDDVENGHGEFTDSELSVTSVNGSTRIIGVRGLEYTGLTNVTLQLVSGATKVTYLGSNNAKEVNVFYEGFNDDLLYATGTRIQATLDNGKNCEWVAYKSKPLADGIKALEVDEVLGRIYRGDEGEILVNAYVRGYANDTYVTELYTPVIKPLSEMPVIEKGTSTISTMSYDSAYSYYRITAGETDEVWNLKFACAGDEEDYWGLYAEVCSSDGTLIAEYEQPYGDESDNWMLYDLDMEVIVPASETIVIGIYDDHDESMAYTLTATKQGDEEETTTVGEPSEVETTTPETSTTEAPTTKDPTTTVAATTTPAPTATVAETTLSPEEEAALMKKPRKVTIKKIKKKKLSAKKIVLNIKKVAGATGYEVAVYKTKKNAKKDEKRLTSADTTKIKFKVKSKKLKNKKKLFVKARAYVTTRAGIKVCGKWSKIKRVKVK